MSHPADGVLCLKSGKRALALSSLSRLPAMPVCLPLAPPRDAIAMGLSVRCGGARAPFCAAQKGIQFRSSDESFGFQDLNPILVP